MGDVIFPDWKKLRNQQTRYKVNDCVLNDLQSVVDTLSVAEKATDLNIEDPDGDKLAYIADLCQDFLDEYNRLELDLVVDPTEDS